MEKISSINEMMNMFDYDLSMESYRESKNIWDETYQKFNITIDKVQKMKDPEDKMRELQKLAPLIDETIHELENLKPDMYDKIISAGSRVLGILNKIALAKNIVTSSGVIRLSSLPTKVGYYAGNFVTSQVLKQFTISKKKQRIQKYITILKQEKIELNALIVQYSNQISYDTSMESGLDVVSKDGKASITGTIKLYGQKALNFLNSFITRIRTWLKEKLYAITNTEYLQLNPIYYKETINAINKINNVKFDPIEVVQRAKAIATMIQRDIDEETANRELEKLKELYAKLKNKQIEVNNSIKPIDVKKPEGNNKIAVPTKDINAIGQYFQKEVQKSLTLANVCKILVNHIEEKHGQNSTSNLCRLMFAICMASTSIMSVKANKVQTLVNGLISSGTVVNQKADLKK